jgi:hypothetical protein
LERHSSLSDSPKFYEDFLPANLATISLSEQEQEEIVERLGRLILSDRIVPEMLWAISKSKKMASFNYLADFVSQNRSSNEEAILQALMGINRFLSMNHDSPLLTAVLQRAAQNEFAESVERWSCSPNPRVREMSVRILNKLNPH